MMREDDGNVWCAAKVGEAGKAPMFMVGVGAAAAGGGLGGLGCGCGCGNEETRRTAPRPGGKTIVRRRRARQKRFR